MDWERNDRRWTDHDFSCFHYEASIDESRETTILTKLENQGLKVEVLRSRHDWKLWFDKATFLSPWQRQSGLCLIIYSQGKSLFGDMGFALPSSLPVPRDIFTETVQKLDIPPCITRTIGREVVYFSTQSTRDNEAPRTLITSTARTASYLENDIAITSTYHVEDQLCLAVVFGCTNERKRELTKRFERLNFGDIHPIIAPGIFFEVERARLEESVDRLLDDFVLKPSDGETMNMDWDKAEMTEFLKSCYKNRETQNQIRALKVQLRKMSRETSKLESLPSKMKAKQHDREFDSQEWRRLKVAGRKIKSRLEEMCNILDNKSNDCNMTIEHMSLTMQTLWNHFAMEDNRLNLHFSRVNTNLASTNKQFSQAMQDDSSQMRSIALLTMVFVPISTVASIFSTNLFSWDAAPGEQIVSQYFWVFVSVSLALTSVVVGAWTVAMHYSKARRQRKLNEASDVEKGPKPFMPIPGAGHRRAT